MATPPPPAAVGDALTKAADRIRATAQWLITAFAAVAAVLIAGSQLSSLGDLGGWRLAVAFICVVIAVAAVAYAIGQAAGVATAGRASLGDLANPDETALGDIRQRVNGDPALLAGYTDVAALSTDYATTLSQRKDALADYYKNVDDQGKEKAARVADAQAQVVDQAAQRLLSVASFYTLSKKFNDARPRMLVGALVGALAIVGFAWAAHPPKKTKPAVAAPAEVTIKLTQEGKKLLSAPLGAACVAKSVSAIVLATTAETAEVVTLPHGGCRIGRFTVSANVGTIDIGVSKATDSGAKNNNEKNHKTKNTNSPPTSSSPTTPSTP